MTTAFWQSLSRRLADRWLTVAAPAAVFWLGGLLCWVYGRGGLPAVQRIAKWLDTQQAATQIFVIALVLLAVGASTVLMNRLTHPALRLMEGYWPAVLAPVRHRLAGRFARQVRAADTSMQQVAALIMADTASTAQREEFVRSAQVLRFSPGEGRHQPTAVGNILRTAETRPADKYGLDAVALWPHLWLLIPEDSRKELVAARAALDAAVGIGGWGLLFLLFTPWAWWAAPAGLAAVALSTYAWVPQRARVFATLVEAVFDLHRNTLYRQVRWPLPSSPERERREGRRLTTYLVHGLDGDDPQFVDDGKA